MKQKIKEVNEIKKLIKRNYELPEDSKDIMLYVTKGDVLYKRGSKYKVSEFKLNGINTIYYINNIKYKKHINYDTLGEYEVIE